MGKLVRRLLFSFFLIVGMTNVSAASFKIGNVDYDNLNDAVAAAPSDGTETTIVMTEDVTRAPGVQVTEGKNLIIDFGGHTYETWEPMVGSNGTETQSFQLLKGSKVHMKNGNLIASTHERSKMFIQNYADLILEDIKIDATSNTYDAFYGLSSNNGKVSIIGNTSILVNTNTHARAFDMCWAPLIGKGTYNGGTQMVVDTTGKFNGLIELDVWGTYSDEGGIKSTLLIKNIDFEGKWSIDDRLKNQLSIEGGVFKKDDSIDLDEFVTGSNITYTSGDSFYVKPSKTLKINEEDIFVAKGSNYTLDVEIPEGYENFVGYSIANTDIASIENGVIVGKAVGTTELVISFGRTGGVYPITVYEVKGEVSESENEQSTNENVSSLAQGLVEKVLFNEEVAGIDDSTKTNIKTAIANGKSVVAEVAVLPVLKGNLDDSVVKMIDDTVANKGEVVGFLNIDVLLKADSDNLGKITKLPEPVKITIDVDKKLGDVPSDKTRKFFVVRIHDGENPEILDAIFIDGKLSFETDRFSSYAYGYTDEAKTTSVDTINPKTVDRIGIYIGILALSVTGVVIIKQRKLREN